ncbi:MAG: hypothetical protein BGO30_03875 [Bacteroidetes bacterium 41-46]|nr:MAG: hypothetical protein BGO30_03875 [Bacteroidetes bacterium 41-46]
MAKGLNLKAVFGADTSEVKKGAKEAQAAINEFEQKASSSVDAFAGLFGTSMGSISSAAKVFQGALLTIGKGFQTSAAGSTLFSKALGILKIALISTGIGAIVVALGALVAYFKRSQDGADALSRTLAPFKVLMDNLVDVFAAVGRAMVKAFQDPKQAIADLWDALKKNIINRFTGIVDAFQGLGKVLKAAFSFDWDGVKAGAKEVGTAMLQITTGLSSEQQKSIAKWLDTTAADIKQRMDASKVLADRQAAYEKKRIAFIKEEADINERITKFREMAADREQYSAEERYGFLEETMRLTQVLGAKRIALAKEAFTIGQAQDDLAENLNSDTEKTNQLYADMVNYQASLNQEMRGLFKEQKRLTSEVEKEKEAREKMAALKGKPILPEVDTSSIDKKINGAVAGVQGKVKPISLKLNVDATGFKKTMIDIAEFNKQLTLAIRGAIEELAFGIGEAIGNLMAGESQWKDFGSMVIGVLANLAITVGKVAISLGTSVIAIETSLTSMQGYIAIAAGIALVALGTWARTSLKNAAGGGASPGVGSQYTLAMSGGGGYKTSPGYGGSTSMGAAIPIKSTDVKITGELIGRGSTLVAIIDSERRSKNLRT